jgi:hypothetical protein
MAAAMGCDGGESLGDTGDAVKLRYTRHQLPRGSRPDAEVDGKLYLLKKVPVLHATYQVRLLAFRAAQERKQLVIRGPLALKAGPSLRNLMVELRGVIRLERTDR